jgi:hypothetical protein
MADAPPFDDDLEASVRVALADLAAASPDPAGRRHAIDAALAERRAHLTRRSRLAAAAVAAAVVLVLGVAWAVASDRSTPAEDVAGSSSTWTTQVASSGMSWLYSFDDIASMAATSDSVVVAEVTGERFEPQSGIALRLLDLEVREVLRGEDPGSFSLGDSTRLQDGVLVVPGVFPVLAPGDTAVLFLFAPIEGFGSRWGTIGPEAIVRVTDDGALELGDHALPSPLAEELRSTTFDELRSLVGTVDDRVARGELAPVPSPLRSTTTSP